MIFPKTIFLFLGSLVILSSCQKSVLSELVVELPETFIVKVKIEEKRKNKRQLQVSIRDKTNHPLEFSNGYVNVNGQVTEWSSRNILSQSRGYNYRIPEDEHEFEITIFWNAIDSYTFRVDEEAGFPGFEDNPVGWNLGGASKDFIITPAPFRDNKIEVSYDIMR